MNRIRRIALAVTGFLAVVLSALCAAPTAFAMRVVPPGNTSTAVTRGSGGLATWEISLIAIGVALAVVVATSLLLRVRFRAQVRPAIR